MVVASSNNAAVNNISQDLPKSSALGEAQGSGEAGQRGRPLSPGNRAQDRGADGREYLWRGKTGRRPPWGLIVLCARQPDQSTAFMGVSPSWRSPKGRKPRQSDADETTDHREWRESYTGPDFAEATAVPGRRQWFRQDRRICTPCRLCRSPSFARMAFCRERLRRSENSLAASRARTVACEADDARSPGKVAPLTRIGGIARDRAPSCGWPGKSADNPARAPAKQCRAKLDANAGNWRRLAECERSLRGTPTAPDQVFSGPRNGATCPRRSERRNLSGKGRIPAA